MRGASIRRFGIYDVAGKTQQLTQRRNSVFLSTWMNEFGGQGTAGFRWDIVKNVEDDEELKREPRAARVTSQP